MQESPLDIHLLKTAVGLFLPEAREGEAQWNALYHKASVGPTELSADELILLIHYTAKFLQTVDGRKNPPLKSRLRQLEKVLGNLLDKRMDKDARQAYGQFLMSQLLNDNSSK